MGEETLLLHRLEHSTRNSFEPEPRHGKREREYVGREECGEEVGIGSSPMSYRLLVFPSRPVTGWLANSRLAL
jgi:hypothetical protein